MIQKVGDLKTSLYRPALGPASGRSWTGPSSPQGAAYTSSGELLNRSAFTRTMPRAPTPDPNQHSRHEK